MFKMINLSSDTLKLDTGQLGGQCVNFHENREKSKGQLTRLQKYDKVSSNAEQ